MQGFPVKNGVVAACRFWEIAQGGFGGSELIDMESASGKDLTISNNAFVWSHAYNCAGPGISINGAGIQDNYFGFLTLDTRSSSIDIAGFKAEDGTGGDSTLVSGNRFENIEMGAWMRLTGHCADNVFKTIVGQRNPLRNGNVTPADIGYLTVNNSGLPPFADLSTYDAGAGEGPNQYTNLYVTTPDAPLFVNAFPITYNFPPYP
jgi:hypothetical protein